jgi:hypothetical protein
VTLADRPQAHDIPGLTRAKAALVGVGDHGGVEEGRTFERNLAGEIGANKKCFFERDIADLGEALSGQAEMARPCGLEVSVAVVEAQSYVGERGCDVGVVHGEDAFDHEWGAGVAAVHLLAGDEKDRDDPPDVGAKPERAPGHDI